jgi:hypothetical protein
VVEGLAQTSDFVLSGQVGAHGKIAPSDLVGQFQQPAQRVDQNVVDQIDGQDHHQKGGNDRCAEDDAHDQNFRFGGLFDLFDQIVDAVDDFGDFVQHSRACNRRGARGRQIDQAGFDLGAPAAFDLSVNLPERGGFIVRQDGQDGACLQVAFKPADGLLQGFPMLGVAILQEALVDRGHAPALHPQAARQIDRLAAALGGFRHHP